MTSRTVDLSHWQTDQHYMMHRQSGLVDCWMYQLDTVYNWIDVFVIDRYQVDMLADLSYQSH